MPIHSMTGYGQAVLEQNGFRVSVELKTVNHRFAEFQIRLAKEYAVLDEAIRDVLGRFVARGRCDGFIVIESAKARDKRVTVDWALLSELVRVEHEAHARGFELAPVNWLTEMDVLTVESVPDDIERVRDVTLAAVRQAGENLVFMRAREGGRLDADLHKKLSNLEEIIQRLTQSSQNAADQVRMRLRERMKELQLNVPAERLLTEVALLAERSAVDEELVRLSSHVREFSRSLQDGSPVGRRLDFVVQEMHREVNTIASKASDFDISKAVVDAKTVIEQMREQVQNIE